MTGWFRAIALAAVLIAVVGACGAFRPPVEVDGRTFLSTAVTISDADRPLVPGTRIRISFADGRVSVSAGCNTMGGRYRLEGGALRIVDGAVTEIGCDPALHAQDEWVFAFLGSGPSFEPADDGFVLAGDDTRVAFVDRERAEPDLPLVGPVWTVVAIMTGDAVSTVPAGAVATIEFDASGGVRFATGCNEGTARAVAEGARLRFEEIGLTKRACDDPAAALEAAVLAVLRSEAVGYRIDAGILQLTAGPSALQLSGD